MHKNNVTEMEAMLRQQRDNLRAERNIMVAMISKMFPSVLAYHSPDDQGNDGANSYDGFVCYIKLPTGQVSFHVGTEARTQWFEHLMLSNVPVWDRHDDDTKWQRIVEFIDSEVLDEENP